MLRQGSFFLRSANTSLQQYLHLLLLFFELLNNAKISNNETQGTSPTPEGGTDFLITHSSGNIAGCYFFSILEALPN